MGTNSSNSPARRSIPSAFFSAQRKAPTSPSRPASSPLPKAVASPSSMSASAGLVDTNSASLPPKNKSNSTAATPSKRPPLSNGVPANGRSSNSRFKQPNPPSSRSLEESGRKAPKNQKNR